MLAWINLLTIFILNFGNFHCNILLYNTEYSQIGEKFDCLYFLTTDGQNIPFCQRQNGVQKLDRNNTKCENEGEAQFFQSLLDETVILQYRAKVIDSWDTQRYGTILCYSTLN
ncbi:unnamed protein product [Adineta steineri]|uniref:Secreted protein n=1 Tax=Adineta steineri TaxID=433720 RepID=A0A819U5J9_9BILA|nr:unnamed protein product [Adineta steineri]CAF1061337.1 unnamed protein product [Adineta steineri]CAF4083780.1 unnamed protein product [Adineta steineri]CAF4136894.1 unnamed protein product [Adineta steineri]